jgi:hypothetical protein
MIKELKNQNQFQLIKITTLTLPLLMQEGGVAVGRGGGFLSINN